MGGKEKSRDVAGGGQSVNLQQRSGKSRPGSRRTDPVAATLFGRLRVQSIS